MRRDIWGFIFIFFFTFNSFSYDRMNAPSPAPTPGEMDAEISTSDFSFSSTNDVLGETDKLVTGGLNFSKSWLGKYYSVRLRTSLTLITPIFKHAQGEEKLSQPIGNVADWMRLQVLQSLIFPTSIGKMKLQLNVAHNKIGNNGLVEVQKFIHDQIDANFFLDEVDTSFRKSYTSADFSLGYISHKFFQFSTSVYFSAGYVEDYFYPQKYIEAGFNYSYNSRFGVQFKYAHIWTEDRGFFKNLILPERTQALLSVRLFKHWNPGIGYSSVYLNGDEVDQWYISAVSFGCNF